VRESCYSENAVADSDGPVAQLVEHRTFNAVVAGSIPARLTNLFNILLNLLFLSDTTV
jgi:hypothetical protein